MSELRCSFCDKRVGEVEHFIISHSGTVRICDLCVATCVEILQSRPNGSPSESIMPPLRTLFARVFGKSKT